jgi:hypothetical protein
MDGIAMGPLQASEHQAGFLNIPAPNLAVQAAGATLQLETESVRLIHQPQNSNGHPLARWLNFGHGSVDLGVLSVLNQS